MCGVLVFGCEVLCDCVILCVATIHKIKRVALVRSREAQCHSTVKHHSTKTYNALFW